jgi:hypothetical protein
VSRRLAVTEIALFLSEDMTALDAVGLVAVTQDTG